MADRAPGDSDRDGDSVDMVDWDVAVSTAKRLMRPGPDVSRAHIHEVVGELRQLATESERHVCGFTQLYAESATAPVLVVDRGGWVQANVEGFRQVLRPLTAKLQERRGQPGAVSLAIGSRVTGVEAGGLLAFLSNKVLGQFDPFYTGDAGQPGDQHGGRLLLVAPNVVHVERELHVDPHDFRLWVCLHEETHRVQFTAVPWLRQHLLDEIAALLAGTELDPGRIAQMLRDGVENIARLVRGDPEVSIVDIVSTPEQRAILERLTAVMSLLEGHADVVMDGVGPEVIPSVDDIRRKFTVRRAGGGPLDQLIRRVLGFDAKMRQYRDGATFVRGVLDRVGMDGFNAVWSKPDNLPTSAEVATPSLWVGRVHGRPELEESRSTP